MLNGETFVMTNPKFRENHEGSSSRKSFFTENFFTKVILFPFHRNTTSPRFFHEPPLCLGSSHEISVTEYFHHEGFSSRKLCPRRLHFTHVYLLNVYQIRVNHDPEWLNSSGFATPNAASVPDALPDALG